MDPSVQQITSILQNLSTVLEYGRRLTWFRKYQKLALEDDLKQMEERQRDNNLGDVRAIAPILKQVAYDQSVMRMTRARAIRLLDAAGKIGISSHDSRVAYAHFFVARSICRSCILHELRLAGSQQFSRGQHRYSRPEAAHAECSRSSPCRRGLLGSRPRIFLIALWSLMRVLSSSS